MMHRERFFHAFLQAAGGARIQFHQLTMQSFQRTLGVGVFGHGVGVLQFLLDRRLMLFGQVVHHVAPLVPVQKPACGKCRIGVPSGWCDFVEHHLFPNLVISGYADSGGIRVLPRRYTALPTGRLLSGNRATDRWALPLLTLRVRHTWDHENPSRRSANTRLASTWARGLPNFLPLARALRSPALTLSWISDRSNSAMAPMIWNISRPEGVLKSRLSRKLTKATPRASRSAREFTRNLRLLANRSNFQTSTTSHLRR